jgi:hypothetical protein
VRVAAARRLQDQGRMFARLVPISRALRFFGMRLAIAAAAFGLAAGIDRMGGEDAPPARARVEIGARVALNP